jgi:hypothetical protein
MTQKAASKVRSISQPAVPGKKPRICADGVAAARFGQGVVLIIWHHKLLLSAIQLPRLE